MRVEVGRVAWLAITVGLYTLVMALLHIGFGNLNAKGPTGLLADERMFGGESPMSSE